MKEIYSIEREAFADSSIMKLNLLASVDILVEWRCQKTNKISEITISPKNKGSSKYNEDIIIVM